MSFDWKDLLPAPPRDGQQAKLTLFGIGAGILLGYNWDTMVSATNWICTVVGDAAYGLLFPEEALPSGPKTKFIVGVGVVVRDGSRILMGRRLNSMGEGLFAVAGGHLDPGETFLQAGVRELREETGLDVFSAFPFDCGAYIHPQTSQEAFEQFCTKTEFMHRLNQGKEKAKHPIINTHPQSSTTLPHPNPHDVFLAEPSVEVYCPEENCQLIVRMVIVDKPRDQEAKRMEDHKCENWYWVEWSDVVKLAQYHDAVARYNHYNHMSPAQKAMVLSHDQTNQLNHTDKLTSHEQQPPQYQHGDGVTGIGGQGTTVGPVGTVPISYLLPTPPQFHPDCILRYTDQLFGPMQALALTGFDPTTPK